MSRRTPRAAASAAMRLSLLAAVLAAGLQPSPAAAQETVAAAALDPAMGLVGATLGPRPFYLVDDMDEGALKQRLQSCMAGPFRRSDFSIGHRGAPMQFPEHTRESYVAAARMGAGILECDVTFTADRELVCRHAQCDLHTTTDILARPELAAKCSVPFQPADPATGREAQVRCCTSDLTLAEFRTLNAKMDAGNPMATTVEAYMDATPGWRTDLYATRGTLMTHAESIELFRSLGARFTPELKAPEVQMPWQGDYSQEDYAQQLIDEYVAAGVDPSHVFPQSFNPADVFYWIENAPEFGRQAVYLDETVERPEDVSRRIAELPDLARRGVRIYAPPTFALVAPGEDGELVPSPLALAAAEAGLDLITWTVERSGPLASGGGWYYQTVSDVTDNDGDMFELIDTLARDVGVRGIFSDWPATTTYYANCMGIALR